jgi:hypothetical protein
MLIYIGIPKCASTSITKALNDKSGVIIIRPNNGVPAHEGIVGTAKRAIKRIPSRVWMNSTKFTVVRNPYDRYVSAWSMFKKHRLERLRFDVSFEEFVKSEKIQSNPSVILHVMPQYEHIIDRSGRKCVPEIGKFENLNDDLNRILKKSGLKEVKLGHHYKSSHDEYDKYYNDKLKDIVKKRCHRDFEAFGY